VNSVAFGTVADGWVLLASGSDDGTVRLWDLTIGTPVGPPLARGHRLRRHLLALPGHGRQRRTLTGHTRRVNSVAFGTGADGRVLLASGSADKTVRLWDPVTAVCLSTLRRRSAVYSVVFAGTLLAIGDTEGLSVIELDG